MCPVVLRMLMKMYIKLLINKLRLNGIMQFLSRVILKIESNKAVAYLLVFLAFT